MNDLQVFGNAEFELRVTPDGDSFRVEAPGLARALGFRAAHDMVRSLPDAEKGYELVRTPGGQPVWYVTEAGFYRAIGQRQAARVKDAGVREQVARFQDWVYGEVLPTIRKTGSYGQSAQQSAAVDLASPDGVLALANAFQAAAQQLVSAQQRVAELEPAAEAWEVLASAEGDFSLRDAAHILSRDPLIVMGQNRLMAFLRTEQMVDRRGVPYARYGRYLVERPVSYTHPVRGEPVLAKQVRITVDGVAFLRNRLGARRGGAPSGQLVLVPGAAS